MSKLEKACITLAGLNVGLNLFLVFKLHDWYRLSAVMAWVLFIAWVVVAGRWRRRALETSQMLQESLRVNMNMSKVLLGMCVKLHRLTAEGEEWKQGKDA